MKQHRNSIHVVIVIAFAIFVTCTSGQVYGGNKRIMTIRAAKVLAERALVETVYGLKLRAYEKVEDMVAASFKGTTESKTKALISGVKFEEEVYDPQRDIAKVTASIQLDKIKNIDGQEINLGNKVFRRVAFATSTPQNAGPLKALRAAELDAYKQLMKRIVGFELESHTKVENYILTSDVVKTKVLATLCLAEVTEYGWTDDGDAYVKMEINVGDLEDILGQKVLGGEKVIQVVGEGAEHDTFGVVNKNASRKKEDVVQQETGQ